MANRYSRIFHHISINDVKKNRDIMIESKRVKENKEMEEKNYIDERMKNKKSNWRESFTNVTVGMKVGQTFSIGGINITTGDALSGVGNDNLALQQYQSAFEKYSDNGLRNLVEIKINNLNTNE